MRVGSSPIRPIQSLSEGALAPSRQNLENSLTLSNCRAISPQIKVSSNPDRPFTATILALPNAEAWAKGVVANFARDPKGGDTDQIKSVAAGECALSIVNTYYYVRMLKSAKPDERAAIEKVGLSWPNQDGRGTHVNISGAGVLKSSRNREAAVKFLEYLASDEAQRYFANGNNEFTVVRSVSVDNRELASLGKFKADEINVSVFGKNQPVAQKVYDRAGWR